MALDGSHAPNPSWYSRLSSPTSTGAGARRRRAHGWNRARSTTSGSSAGPGRRVYWVATAGSDSALGGEVGGARPDDACQHRLDPVVAAHHEQRLRRQAAVLEPDGDDLVARGRDPPFRPAELAVLEVADRVGREQAVLLEERAQQRAVGRRPGQDRARWPTAIVAISRRPRRGAVGPGRVAARRRRRLPAQTRGSVTNAVTRRRASGPGPGCARCVPSGATRVPAADVPAPAGPPRG